MTIDTSRTPLTMLREQCGDLVLIPGEPGFEEAATPWNLAALQHPAAVAVPRTVDDVARVVRGATAAGFRVAPQGTGHSALSLALQDLSQVVLLRTGALAEVTIDAPRRCARIGAGVLWQDVVEAAAPHGLAALHGSSPDVGVAGFSLGGGIGWYARKHGLAADSVLAVELVTADGEFVRADADENADLFWALRGGGGNFGVVTALEMRLFDIRDAFAGMLIWDISAAERVLAVWAPWAEAAPDEVSTSFRVMRLPALPELPDFLRGRQIVVIDGAALGDDEFGAAQFAPLRALSPEIDTFTRMPAAALTRLHMDPEGPAPAVGSALTLGPLDADAQRAFLQVVGAGAESALTFAEFRQLGGALGRGAMPAGAIGPLNGQYAGFFAGIAPTREVAALVQRDASAVVQAMTPWAAGTAYLNFSDEEIDPRTGYDEESWDRLRRVRERWDGDGVFVANHPIPVG